MKLYLIAGEASGDLHGSNLIKALHHLHPGLECRAWGGEMMQDAGSTLVKHYRDLAFMGFWEVIKNLRTILGNLDFCKKDILAFQPDAIVLIDYPGFNLRIARWAKEHGIRVVYYISPQIWAWHRSRVHAMKRDIDQMLVILPFEPDFFKQYGMEVTYVGHPLLDAIGPGLSDAHTTNNQIALLPGSRKQEVQRILPVMLEATRHFPNHHFVIAAANVLNDAYFQNYIENYPNVKLVRGQTYDVLRSSCAALVKSGTSTLETALLDVPQVVCYAGNPLSYHIAKRLVKVPYISLVNLIMDQPLVKELIQDELTPENVQSALNEILQPMQIQTIKQGYALLREKLGAGGASERAARAILENIPQSTFRIPH
ncbi:MAG: lipid-A-disaccharide synthase [Saprospiraceae bacterium]|nr:lipid-A-disaccharide synthase [Saprospiraceae bacterium]